jgi:hypothetical protein
LEDKRQEKAEILQKNLIKYQFIFNDGSQEPLTLVYSKDTDKLYSYSDGIHAKPLRYYLNKADNHEIEIKSKKI